LLVSYFPPFVIRAAFASRIPAFTYPRLVSGFLASEFNLAPPFQLGQVELLHLPDRGRDPLH
jgi:hypothetical protein